MKKNVLIIGAGGVAQVVAHKCARIAMYWENSYCVTHCR